MKVVVALVLGLCVSNASAWDYQQQAEAKFDAMSAQEAWNSDFVKHIMNPQMPGTSTWVKPTGLCIDGNTVRTVNAIGYCVQWTGKDKDGDVRTFDNYLQAKSILKGNINDKCSAKDFRILSTPIQYAAEKCTLWSAKGGDDDNWKVKTFSSQSAADDYGSNVTCVNVVKYTATFPTTFKVEYYRNRVENDRYLGSHTYGIGRCNGGSTPAVEAY